MRISLIALILIPAVLLGGCGGSGASSSASSSSSDAASSATTSHTTTTRSSRNVPSASVSTSSSAASTSSPTSASSTTAASTSGTGAGGASIAGPGDCRAGQLALAYLGGRGATGHGELGFALRNTTPSSCPTGGYPGIQFLDRSGRALPTNPTHTTSDFFGALPLARVTVAPGASFSFRLGVSHGGGADTGCTTAYGLQVIPPNDTATLQVDIPGGASECGATTVSPVQPGTSAFQ